MKKVFLASLFLLALTFTSCTEQPLNEDDQQTFATEPGDSINTGETTPPPPPPPGDDD